MSDKEKVPRQRGRVENVGGGRYKVTVYVGLGSDGKRLYHRKTLRNSTEAKARKYARDIASQAERGDYFAPPKVTLGQLFDDALERWRRNGLRQTTLEARERHVRLHALPALGADTQIGKLTTAALQGFYDRLLDGGYKPSSVRLVHATVKACLRRAVRHGLLRVNPADLVELPPRNKPKKAKVFDEDEAVRFVEAAWRERRYVIFVFALVTGMRPSDFFGVEYTDLSLETFEAGGLVVERGVARVTKAVVWSKGRWFFNEPKTGAGKRTIYFPGAIYHELTAQKGEHLERLGRLGQKHQLVFTNTLGGPLNRANLTRRFFSACKRAGLSTEGRSLYTLRRSHATLSVLSGDNLKALSERLGHVSVEFTQDEYVDALPAMQRRAADNLESKLLRTQLAPFEGGREM